MEEVYFILWLAQRSSFHNGQIKPYKYRSPKPYIYLHDATQSWSSCILQSTDFLCFLHHVSANETQVCPPDLSRSLIFREVCQGSTQGSTAAQTAYNRLQPSRQDWLLLFFADRKCCYFDTLYRYWPLFLLFPRVPPPLANPHKFWFKSRIFMYIPCILYSLLSSPTNNNNNNNNIY